MKTKNWSQQNDDEKAALGGEQPRLGTADQTQNPKKAKAAAGSAAQPTQGGQRLGQQRDESGQSGRQRAEQRVQRPGKAGLANENRPGLGTRGDPTSNQQESQGRGGSAGQQSPAAGQKLRPKVGGDVADQKKSKAPEQKSRSAPDPGADTSRPAPNEQRSDSFEQEQQRSTGMSGQSGGV